MTLPVAILAGGLATRLRPVTEKIPKSMLDVNGRPFILHQLALLKNYQLTEVVLCVGYLGEMLRDYLGDGSRYGFRISYVFDGDKLLGTGGALRKALAYLGEAFFVLYGDSYLECDYLAIEKSFLKSQQLGMMTVCQNANRWDKSNVLFKDGKILKYDKKQQTSEMKHIDYGLGIFKSEVFRAYPEDVVFDLAAVYQDLLLRHQLAAFEVDGRFYEIGSLTGLEETRNYLASKGMK